MTIQTRPSELALPVRALAALRDGLAEEVGADAAARALRRAGGAAGDSLFRALAVAAGVGPEEDQARAALARMPHDRFWSIVSLFFQTRGWGRLSFAAVHDGVGALDAADWVESGAEAGRPSCFLTTGLLAGLLSRVSGSEVAVLEVECHSSGADRCRFLFGSPEALEAVYADVAAGRDAVASLEALA